MIKRKKKTITITDKKPLFQTDKEIIKILQDNYNGNVWNKKARFYFSEDDVEWVLGPFADEEGLKPNQKNKLFKSFKKCYFDLDKRKFYSGSDNLKATKFFERDVEKYLLN